jgi:hypothetical protein
MQRQGLSVAGKTSCTTPPDRQRRRYPLAIKTMLMTEQLDLTAEEKAALIALLKRTLEYARFPLAPRLNPLKAILEKLEPPAPKLAALSALLIVFLVLVGSVPLYPALAEGAEGGYETGNELLSRCMSSDATDTVRCLGYLFGVADAMHGGDSIYGFKACMPLQVAGGQLKDIAVQFLQANAPNRHLQAASLIANAFQDAFPSR